VIEMMNCICKLEENGQQYSIKKKRENHEGNFAWWTPLKKQDIRWKWDSCIMWINNWFMLINWHDWIENITCMIVATLGSSFEIMVKRTFAKYIYMLRLGCVLLDNLMIN
jgi:hypothetical protein